jgi:hypothetical protein
MSGPEAARGVAPARAALAGNQSDGYGGAVLAVTVDELRAEALAKAGTVPSIDPPSDLIRATVARFARELGLDAATAALSWRTSIPRGVGLERDRDRHHTGALRTARHCPGT